VTHNVPSAPAGCDRGGSSADVNGMDMDSSREAILVPATRLVSLPQRSPVKSAVVPDDRN
jgi:hypothetical protein